MKIWRPYTFGRKRPTIRRPGRWGAKLSVLLLFALLALVFGVSAALIGGLPVTLILGVILMLAFAFGDYRVGVAGMAFFLPWAASPLLPHGKGMSVSNFLLLAALLSFGIHVLMQRRPLVHFPRILWWCYLVPFSIGMMVALRHLGEAAANLAIGEDAGTFQTLQFVKGYYVDALVYVVFAFLLANAVRESKRPERWMIVFGAAALLPVAAVAAMVSLYRVSLTDLQAMRGFLVPLGYSANEMSWLLATLFGPLLYVAAVLKGWVRVVAVVVAAAVGVALTLTFTRGGFLALIVMLVMFAISRKRLLALFLVSVVVVAGMLAVPAVRERAFTGVEAGAVAQATDKYASHADPLTSGRLVFWQLLLPEVARSPVWGRGVGSTRWSEAARSGAYLGSHPHNLFLQIAMDLGLVGLGLLLYLYYRIGRTYARLSREPSLPAPTRAFFAGSLATLVGCAIMGATTGGHYVPRPENAFLWFSLGMAMPWWHLGQAAPVTAGAPRRPRVFGIRPMPQRHSTVGKTGMS